MDTVADVKTELAAIKILVVNVAGDVTSLIAQIEALKIGVATQADIDELAAAAREIKASLTEVDSKEPPAPV